MLGGIYRDDASEGILGQYRARSGVIVVGYRRVVRIAVNTGGHCLTSVDVTLFEHLEIVERAREKNVVVPLGRSCHAGSSPYRRSRRSDWSILDRLDHDHAVAGPRSVDGRGRRILEDLNRCNVLGVQEVDIRARHRRAVDNVKGIVVLKRADAANSDRASRTWRTARLNGHTGNGNVQRLEHACLSLL